MKARRRLIITALFVLVFFIAVGIAVWLRKKAAPEPARLLPEADTVVYVDLETVRNLTSLASQTPPQRAQEYQDFVSQTGFSFERDLDEAAFAVHRGANKGQTRFSEVLIGHYDQQKVAQYLREHSRAVEKYRDVDIYSIPIENRTVRVALLAIDTVAISNVDDPSVVKGMIDRFKKVALPFGGPRVIREYYRRVPLGSLLWSISYVPASPNGDASHSLTLPGGIDVFVPSDSYVVASVRMLAAIHARAQFFTHSEEDAKRFADQAGSFLTLFRSIQSSAQLSGTDPDVKAVFDSIRVDQKGSRAEVSAQIPTGFLRKLVSEPPVETLPPVVNTPPPPPMPEKKAPSKKKSPRQQQH